MGKVVLSKHSLGLRLVVAVAANCAVVAGAQAQPDANLASLVAASPDYGVVHFYKGRDYRPLWIRSAEVSPEARQLLAILTRAEVDGIAIDPRLVERAAVSVERVRTGSSADGARAELMLSSAWVEYVQALSKSDIVGVTYIDASLAPTKPYAAVILQEAAVAPSLADHLDAISRLNPIYEGMRDQLTRWRAQWAHLPRVAVPAGSSLVQGSTGERVRLLRTRLGLTPGSEFDARAAAAMISFKTAHGLPATPVADAAAIARLNQDPAEIEQRFRLNLDRARLLPGGRGKYIVVDAASARLWLFEDGEVRDSMKVVVGKASEQTPMVAGLIRSMVLNPYWNVPPDLVRERIAPRVLKQGVGYLRESRYEVLSGWADDAEVLDPTLVDWNAVASGRSSLRVRQLPGAGNAMGAMKFMFPNSFGVYLHDTPDKSLFAKADRALSSGCVRLEDAGRVAAWLFGSRPAASARNVEEAVALTKPVPVYLTYLTVDWDQKSPVATADVYGRDKLAAARHASKIAGSKKTPGLD